MLSLAVGDNAIANAPTDEGYVISNNKVLIYWVCSPELHQSPETVVSRVICNYTRLEGSFLVRSKEAFQ